MLTPTPPQPQGFSGHERGISTMRRTVEKPVLMNANAECPHHASQTDFSL